LSSTTQWWSVGIGIGSVFIGVAILLVCIALMNVLSRLGKTLDEVDRQIATLGVPVATTLTHVGGIANTADSTLARAGVAVAQLESVAAKATNIAAQIGTAVNNVVSGLRRSKPDDATTPVLHTRSYPETPR